MSLRSDLVRQFQDPDYRHAYADSFVDSSIATQIQVLREQRELSQSELGDATGMKQSQISRLENVNNSSWQIRTLKRIAQALDVVLVVKFESFGKILPDIESFGRKALERPSFAEDPEFGVSVTSASDDSVSV